MPPKRALVLRVMRLTVWLLVLVSCYCGGASSQLTADFYATSCPDVSSIVETIVSQAVQAETRMAASLLRLHFHDCFVHGCDGSILLDGSASEKLAPPNVNSVRGFEVVDAIKSAVESACSGTVSCADILALAAQASIPLVGGPSWTVLLGRRDSTTPAANQTTGLPGPKETLDVITKKFANVGLNSTDVVVLSGAHTIGFSHCRIIADRLYNYSGTGQADPSLNSKYRETLETTCPQGGDPNVLVPLDRATQNTFDRCYYSNLRAREGLLQSDQELYENGASTKKLVHSFASHQRKFFTDFAVSMVKMGNISPLTGSDGEIRLNCRTANS